MIGEIKINTINNIPRKLVFFDKVPIAKYIIFPVNSSDPINVIKANPIYCINKS
jgi:hypothetical protein